MAARLAERPVVVIAVPGTAGDAVAAEVARCVGEAGRPSHTARVSRSDRGRPGAAESRLPDPSVAPLCTVVVDAQWADDESLTALSERCSSADLDRPVVVIHRAGTPPRALAEVQLAARRAGAALTLVAGASADLVAGGSSAAEAARVIAATDGYPDLVAALELDGALGPEITARLSVLDDGARRAAELIAFGAEPSRLGDLAPTGGAGTEGAIDALEVDGLLHDGRMVAGVAAAVREVCTPSRRAPVIRLLVDHGDPGTAVELGRMLLALDDRSAAAGEVYVALADSLAAIEPTAALGFVEAARRAGRTDPSLVVCEAVTSLADGDARRALRVLQGCAPAPDVESIRAAAWAALGDLEAASGCLARSDLAALAVWAATGAGLPVGDLPAVLDGGRDDAADAVAASVQAWREGSPGDVLERLKRAGIRYRTEAGTDRWPLTPDLLTALIAVRLGRADLAEQVMTAAVTEGIGGPAHRRGHLLVAAWIAARRGHLDDAAVALDQLGTQALTPQEELWRAATRCAIAVRDSEADALEPALAAASVAMAGVNTHLYDLDLLTDVAAVANRTRVAIPADPFAIAESAIERLGRPDAFVFDLAWCRLRAALAGDDLSSIATRAQQMVALGDAPAHLTAPWQAAAVLQAAGAGDVSADVAEAAARDLAGHGDTHEAARLCGVLALRMHSEADTRRLLKESRTWRAQRTQLKRVAGADRSVIRLSEQEERVAQMVLDGHTHKQIGSALFISAKTVEHHVAHIRTKLGAGSRAELLAAIRTYLAGSTAAA